MLGVKITESAFNYLDKLKQNNDKTWFTQHKSLYLSASADIANFADGLLEELNKHDVIETPNGSASQYRIHRDIRFSSDKKPYNTYWEGGFKRAGRERRGEYFFHFEPGNKSFLSGDFCKLNAGDLKLIRDDIAFNPLLLKKILNSPAFFDYFGVLRGDQLKSSPKGFHQTHEAIDLLRYKQFVARRYFTDEQVLGPGFFYLANETLKVMRPFLDYISDVLSQDANSQ